MATQQAKSLGYLETLSALESKLRDNFTCLADFMKSGGAPAPLVLAHSNAANDVNKQLSFMYQKAELGKPMWVPLYKARSGKIPINLGGVVLASQVSQILNQVPQFKKDSTTGEAISLGGAELSGNTLKKIVDTLDGQKLDQQELLNRLESANVEGRALLRREARGLLMFSIWSITSGVREGRGATKPEFRGS